MNFWLTKGEVMAATGWQSRMVERKARLGELHTRHAKSSCRNGRREREYASASLPAEAQLKVAKQRIGDSASSGSARGASEQRTLFAPLPEITERERLALPTAALQEQARQRREAIAAMIDFKTHTNGHRPTFTTHDGREINNLDALAKYLAQQQRVSPRTLWNWYTRYQEEGHAALANRARSDKEKSRFFEEHAAAGVFAQSKYLAERLSVRLVHEAMVREWPRLRLQEDDAAPSYSTLRMFLNALPAPLTVMAREGERQFTERVAPYLLTDFKSLRANQIWVSDHCRHDVFVRNCSAQGGPFFAGVPTDAAIRPWLTAIIDMRSRRAVGAVWCGNPSSHSISSALRSAILENGIPETFYIDNGKDYRKVGKIDFSPELSGLLPRLGIASQYCLPKHPQSKLIESWFATMHKRFDAMWRQFYCGSLPSRRSEDCDLVLKQHELFLRGKAQSSPLPLASEFMAMAARWVEDYNSTHSHSGRGMNGRTPDEIFNELLPAEKRRVVDDPRALDSLFWDRNPRKVSEGGCVQINNERYEPADPQSAAALFMEIERTVVVACDPYNLGEAVALDQDGRFLGALRAQKLLARGPVSHDDIKASMRLRRAAARAVKDYVAGLAHQRAQAGDLTELSQLRKRSAGIARMPQISSASPLPRLQAVNESARYADDIAERFLREED